MSDHSTEIWKDIKSCEGYYQVSNLGRVRSMKRVVIRKNGHRLTVDARILKPHQSAYNLVVDLRYCGIRRNSRVHRLVLEAFVGPCPRGMEVCHNDGNFRNNRLENLRWDTHKNNGKDMVAHDRSPKGTRHGMVKLTDEKVREMRRLYTMGIYSSAQLGEMFGVHQVTASRVVGRRGWSHIE